MSDSRRPLDERRNVSQLDYETVEWRERQAYHLVHMAVSSLAAAFYHSNVPMSSMCDQTVYPQPMAREPAWSAAIFCLSISSSFTCRASSVTRTSGRMARTSIPKAHGHWINKTHSEWHRNRTGKAFALPSCTYSYRSGNVHR